MMEHAQAQFDLLDVRGLDDGSACLSPLARLTLGANDTHWTFAVLAQIGNFITLRRALGKSAADRLAAIMVARIETLMPTARVSVAARDLAEIVLTGESRIALEPALAILAHAFEAPCEIDGMPATIEVVLGAAALGAGDVDLVRLVEEAEAALREAHNQPGPVVRDLDTAAARVDRIALARELTVAIGQDELFLQYQPKIHLRRQKIAGLEALIRWRHPVRGLISPNDFIPIAEESRDIVAMTLWTLRRAIDDQRVLLADGHDLPIFINIAGALLADTGFVRQACGLVEASGARVGFEITETSVIRDPDSAIANLKIFADIGITIAIDDYGAGLSSLAYLKQLPARELKIDKLFVTQLTSSNRDPLIVRSTIDLAHALDMEVVAEGVETPATLALLSVMGCDMVQGYLISRPLSLDALLPYLAEECHLAAAAEADRSIGALRLGWKRA